MGRTEQNRFMSYELGLLTIKAALSTRDRRHPIYDRSVKAHQRAPVRRMIREILDETETKYSKRISEKDHIKYISDVSDHLTNCTGQYLHNNEFRVGIAQKLINMHLKYLWCSNVIDEPPHCPIDGIVRDKVKDEYPRFDYDWTSSNCIKEYKNAISLLRKKALNIGQTLAYWELTTFRRRDDVSLR